MVGYYAGKPPSMKECLARAPCSPVTARKIIAGAKARGLFVCSPAVGDHRMILIHASPECVAEFESMVDNYCAFIPTIVE